MQDSTFIIRIRHKYILDYNQNIRNISLIKLRLSLPSPCIHSFCNFIYFFGLCDIQISLTLLTYVGSRSVSRKSKYEQNYKKKKSLGIIRHSLIKIYL